LHEKERFKASILSWYLDKLGRNGFLEEEAILVHQRASAIRYFRSRKPRIPILNEAFDALMAAEVDEFRPHLRMYISDLLGKSATLILLIN
jgi:hypothetical protein